MCVCVCVCVCACVCVCVCSTCADRTKLLINLPVLFSSSIDATLVDD